MSRSVPVHSETTASGKVRIPALTGIRGVAAVWVAVFHMTPFLARFLGLPLPTTLVSRGYLGVDLFFILSGFVLAMTYAPALSQAWRPALARFAIGRLFRILPLHWFVLCVMLALTRLWPDQYWSPGLLTPASFVASLLLVQAWLLPNAWSLAWNFPAWSLSAEWLSYVFFPVAAWAAFRIRRGELALALSLLCLLALCALLILTGDPSLQHTGRLAAPRCLAEFTGGVLLWRAKHLGALQRVRGDAAFFVGLALVAFAAAAPPFELIAPFGFVAMIVGCASPARAPAALLGGRTVEFLGEISFSLYLTHTVIMSAFEAMVGLNHLQAAPLAARLALVVALAAAALTVPVLTWRFIEIPGQALGRRLQRARSSGIAKPGTAG